MFASMIVAGWSIKFTFGTLAYMDGLGKIFYVMAV